MQSIFLFFFEKMRPDCVFRKSIGSTISYLVRPHLETIQTYIRKSVLPHPPEAVTCTNGTFAISAGIVIEHFSL